MIIISFHCTCHCDSVVAVDVVHGEEAFDALVRLLPSVDQIRQSESTVMSVGFLISQRYLSQRQAVDIARPIGLTRTGQVSIGVHDVDVVEVEAGSIFILSREYEVNHSQMPSEIA